MMPDGIWIGLGGNQAGSESALRTAIGTISRRVPFRAVSSLYVTAPRDYLLQADFLNAVAWFDLPEQTKLTDSTGQAGAFLSFLLELEITLGRNRMNQIPKGPRLIDLDLLLWGSINHQGPNLVLPHPAMHQRRFVLDPLLELEPGLQDPVSGRLYLEWQNTCLDQAIYSKRSLGYTDQSV